MCPLPAGARQMREVGWPGWVLCGGFVLELVSGLNDDEGRAGDQVRGLEQAIDRSFRHEVALGIGKSHSQFPRRELRLVKRQCDDPRPDVIGDAVPHSIGPRAAIVQRFRPIGLIEVVPSIKRGSRDSDLLQVTANRQMGLLDDPNDV